MPHTTASSRADGAEPTSRDGAPRPGELPGQRYARLADAHLAETPRDNPAPRARYSPGVEGDDVVGTPDAQRFNAQKAYLARKAASETAPPAATG